MRVGEDVKGRERVNQESLVMVLFGVWEMTKREEEVRERRVLKGASVGRRVAAWR